MNTGQFLQLYKVDFDEAFIRDNRNIRNTIMQQQMKKDKERYNSPNNEKKPKKIIKKVKL